MSATIMVVDDSAYARRVLRRVLESGGYTVIEASGGMAALEAYFVHSPEVVLLDLTMEDLNGVDVLRRLREGDPDARVVVVSADVQETTEQLVRDAGALEFLGKPTPPDRILASVADALDMS